MKQLILSFAMILALLGTGCRKDSPEGPGQPKPIDLPDKAGAVISSSNAFGIDLFRITALGDDGNLMLSPLSASTALTMLLNGCSTATYDQIRDMLGYEGLTLEEINATYQSLVSQLLTVDPKVELALANAVWYRQDFQVKQPFLAAMDQSYDATIGALDFLSPDALETINGWASDNTRGRIPKVLDQIDPDAVMFLMNALYFKGTWTYKFGEDSFKGQFYPTVGGAKEVVFMKEVLPVKIFSDSQATAIELPYGSQNFAMDIIVPVGTLNDYLQDFNEDEWNSLVAGLNAISNPAEVNLILPRFKFEYEKKLNDQLKSLGMTDAFEPERADLTGISDEDIYVSFVKQNAFVEVNEDGTEAAAVTTIGISYTSVGDEPETILVDKPFIFGIRERMTKTVLFIGKVESPESN